MLIIQSGYIKAKPLSSIMIFGVCTGAGFVSFAFLCVHAEFEAHKVIGCAQTKKKNKLLLLLTSTINEIKAYYYLQIHSCSAIAHNSNIHSAHMRHSSRHASCRW